MYIKKKKLILDYNNWIILCDGNFPSTNYCLFNKEKATRWQEKQELPASGVAYCGSLADALILLYQELIIENYNIDSFEPNLKDLYSAIMKTKEEFKALLNPELSELS